MNITVLITFFKGQFHGKNVKPLQFSIRPILTAALHKRSVSTVLCSPQVLAKNMPKVMFLAYFSKSSLQY
jgi:hypothetical protein